MITGLSGAGRSGALAVLEDLGWYKVDNLPPALLPDFVELVERDPRIEKVVFSLGAVPNTLAQLPAIEQLRETGNKVRVLFLECPVETLVHRYEATRRPHPNDDGSGRLSDAIEREAVLLEPVKALADVVVDTGDFNVHQLRSRLIELFGLEDDRIHISVTSFGYKYGLPRDVDLVFDCRFLPNPHWDPELRELSGLDGAVREFVLGDTATDEFLAGLDKLLQPLLPAYEAEGKSYLTIAMGCTGGRHRSVALAEELGRRLWVWGFEPSVHHRDVDR